eukprot:8330364-Alexandrium_andersonii.AAC.1
MTVAPMASRPSPRCRLPSRSIARCAPPRLPGLHRASRRSPASRGSQWPRWRLRGTFPVSPSPAGTWTAT